MSDLLEIAGNEQSIGDLAGGIVTKIGKEREMSTAVEPVKAGTVTRHHADEATPMSMLDRAIAGGASIEVLTQLMALQERHEATLARKAFDTAISNAKAKIAPVVRNATGHNNKRYADFSAIARTVDPILSEFGLSYRFKTSQTDRINVTCIISHREGHSEETTLSGPADTSGNKNAIQAIGSTLSYLQRYSLVAALGLAAANDDDGHSSGHTVDDELSEDQIIALREKIESVGLDTQKFCAKWQISAVSEFPARKYQEAINSLDSYARKRANG